MAKLADSAGGKSDPEASITRCTERQSGGTRETIAKPRLPKDEANAIKPIQTSICSQPQIPIRGLSNRANRSSDSVPGCPCGMCKLSGRFVRVEPLRGTAEQSYAQADSDRTQAEIHSGCHTNEPNSPESSRHSSCKLLGNATSFRKPRGAREYNAHHHATCTKYS